MQIDVIFRDAQPGDEAAVQQLVRTVLVEYGLSPDRGRLDTDLEDLHANYIAPGGAFRILMQDGALVGCGGLYPVDAQTAEVRKMYFVPSIRGRGLGRQLLDDLITRARDKGFAKVILQTASPLKEAQALYLRAGFVEVPAWHVVSGCDKGFELSLAGPATVK